MLGVCTHLGCVLIVEAGDYGGWVSYCICDADFRVLTAFSPLYVHSVFLSRSIVLPLPVSIKLNLLLILSETDFVSSKLTVDRITIFRDELDEDQHLSILRFLNTLSTKLRRTSSSSVKKSRFVLFVGMVSFISGSPRMRLE